jgi:hypothetical protein
MRETWRFRRGGRDSSISDSAISAAIRVGFGELLGKRHDRTGATKDGHIGPPQPCTSCSFHGSGAILM